MITTKTDSNTEKVHELHIKTKARIEKEMRDELMGTSKIGHNKLYDIQIPTLNDYSSRVIAVCRIRDLNESMDLRHKVQYQATKISRSCLECEECEECANDLM